MSIIGSLSLSPLTELRIAILSPLDLNPERNPVVMFRFHCFDEINKNSERFTLQTSPETADAQLWELHFCLYTQTLSFST